MNSTSPFLFASSWTALDLANHLWQSTAVGAFILVLLTVCGSLSARTRQTLAWIGLTKFILPITIFTSLTGSLGTPAPARWLESKTLELPALLASASLPAADQPSPFPLAVVLAGAWLAGAIALAGFQVSRAFRLRRQLLQNAIPLPAAFERPLADAASVVGLSHPPRGLSVAAEFSPAVLSAIRPVIVLPRGLETTLAPAELRSVLIHECVHLQRRDHLWSAVQAALICLFWFHPLVWLLHRRLSLETEKSCDERVLRLTQDADAYARGIVKCVRLNLGLASPILLGVSTPPVVERLKAILRASPHREPRLARAAALAAGLLGVALSGHAGTFTRLDSRAGSFIPSFTVADPLAAETDLSSTDTPPSLPSAANASTLTALERGTRWVEQLERTASSASLDSDPASLSHAAHSRADGEALERLHAFQSALKAAAPERPFPTVDSTINPPRLTLIQFTIPQGRPRSTDASASGMRVPIRVVSTAALGQGIEVFDISKLDKRPEPKFQAKPVYPAEMRRAGIAGSVLVDFIVNSNGAVQNAYAIRSSRPEFEAAAVQAVSKWTFRPGRKNNRAVNTHMQVPIVFTRNDER